MKATFSPSQVLLLLYQVLDNVLLVAIDPPREGPASSEHKLI
jgi:hypothetical protein